MKNLISGKSFCDLCKVNQTKGGGQDRLIYKNSEGVTRVYDICPDCGNNVTHNFGPGLTQDGIQSTNDSQRDSQETPVIKKGWPR